MAKAGYLPTVLWFKMAQKRPKPQKRIFQKKFESYFFTFLGLNRHTGDVKKVCLRGPGWLDWTKVAFFGIKIQIFAIFRWFRVQKLQITNLCAFVRCLISQFSIVRNKQNRIKNIFCAYLGIKKKLTDIFSNPGIFHWKIFGKAICRDSPGK